MFASTLAYIAFAFIGVQALSVPYESDFTKAVARDFPGTSMKDTGSQIFWYADPDVSKCSQATSDGNYLKGLLFSHRDYNGLLNQYSGTQLGTVEGGACFNVDKYVLNDDGNANKNTEKSTAQKIGIWVSDTSYNTVVFMPRANCDIQAGDVPTYAYLTSEHCFQINSPDNALVLVDAGTPDIVSFYIYKPTGTTSQDTATCKNGSPLGTDGCAWVPMAKPSPTTSSTPAPTTSADPETTATDTKATATANNKATAAASVTAPAQTISETSNSNNSNTTNNTNDGNTSNTNNTNITNNITNNYGVDFNKTTSSTTTAKPTVVIQTEVTVTPSTQSMVTTVTTRWIDP